MLFFKVVNSNGAVVSELNTWPDPNFELEPDHRLRVTGTLHEGYLDSNGLFFSGDGIFAFLETAKHGDYTFEILSTNVEVAMAVFAKICEMLGFRHVRVHFPSLKEMILAGLRDSGQFEPDIDLGLVQD